MRLFGRTILGIGELKFGMLIAYLEELGEDKNSQNLQDLEQFYKDAKVRFDSSPEFADRAKGVCG